ncbi:MAG: ribonuclease P protein component [Pseudomonadota bacterium]
MRRDFLAAARSRRWVSPGLILQGRDRTDTEPARVGFTCSKKIGNAVVRNRAKRRLREAARVGLSPEARPGWDYVLIGRPCATVGRPFAALVEDLRHALERVHRPASKQKRSDP